MILYVAFRNIFRNKRRTAAVMVTVALGAGSLFIFHGFNAGIMNQYRANTIHSRYGHGQINTAGYRDKVFEKPWEHWIENYDELKPKLLQLPGVDKLFPRIEFFALLTNGRINVSGRGQGIDGAEEAEFFNTLNVVQGKTLTTEPDGVLLGVGLAHSLDLKPGDKVTVLASTVNGSMNGVDLTVTGIFHTGAKEFDDRVFRLPIAQAQTILDTKRIEAIAMGMKSVEVWPAFAAAMAKQYPNLETTSFEVLDKVYYKNSVDWLDSQFKFIQFIIITIVILGIFTTISTSVLERKQEIGNLRANGESFYDILKLLSAEGVVLGILGASLGIAIAWLLTITLFRDGVLMPPAPGLTRQYYVIIELQFMMAVQTFLMGLFCAALAASVAGVRVARLPIGEALRSL